MERRKRGRSAERVAADIAGHDRFGFRSTVNTKGGDSRGTAPACGQWILLDLFSVDDVLDEFRPQFADAETRMLGPLPQGRANGSAPR